ncbi:MAG: DNA-directed RNA polymerase subunit beta [Chloroflexota bacterium]|nr:DNA-directed RNA polymerase subunit beta [Chloroflexota bacterium]
MINSACKSYAKIPDILPLPNLIEVQLDSFKRFQEEGLRELFDDLSPIVSYNKDLELYFLDYRFGEPDHGEKECRHMDLTYSAPLWVNVRLLNRKTGEIKEQEIFMGDFPLMTRDGTFIINGIERVVVSQLIRSPGIYFYAEEDRRTGHIQGKAKLIPDHGVWMEFKTHKRDDIIVTLNRKRIPVTILLRALAAIDDGTDDEILKEGTDQELLELFAAVDNVPERPYIATTMAKEPPLKPQGKLSIAQVALLVLFRRMRPGDPLKIERANDYLTSRLLDNHRYDLGVVGRYKLNRRLGVNVPLNRHTLTKKDLVKVVQHLIRVNNGVEKPDDIDHLGNRRVKTMGELLKNHLRIGFLRMGRSIRGQMSIRDPEQATPISLINIRPVVASGREFFGSSQLSQFMEQTNPLAGLTHKRTLSAMGPGGLKRRRAGFEVRDVHRSHYGRICPIETPEGPNIGLIGRLATYGRVNDYGFIETPYRKVISTVPNEYEKILNKTLREEIKDSKTEKVVAEAGAYITSELAERIASMAPAISEVKIVPMVTNDIEYLAADEEEHYTIAQANTRLDEKEQLIGERISVRRGGEFLLEAPEEVEYMDVSSKQIVGISAALIPFLEHDDANRALMGSNMQRQGVPLLLPDLPVVGTGMEKPAGLASDLVVAEADGEVVSATGRSIIVESADGHRHVYPLDRYRRSNQSTCLDQRPIVSKGDWVKKGDVLADNSSTVGGELALGQNVLVAFLSWEGGNYEDAVLISEDLVRKDKFTSIHIEKYEIEAHDTRLGPEEITCDIPSVGEDALKDLDEDGIIRIGAEVGPGDVLVGEVTPKGERELSPEEKLLRAIFGEKARDVKDSSLRMPHGQKGKVIDMRVFEREEHRGLPAGVNKLVRISVAEKRRITAGDKISGRHGNKGVISKVVPIGDMPFLPDGTPVELILNPLGVPGRMNIGQILETHLGWAAHRLGFRAVSSVFDGTTEDEIEAELARAWLMDKAWDETKALAWEWLREMPAPGLSQVLEDDEELRLLYLSWQLKGKGYDEEALASDRVYARRIALREWLSARGYNPDELLVFAGDIRPLRERREADRKARLVCLREWLKERITKGEWQEVDIARLSDEELQLEALHASKTTNIPLPITGKMILYDGKTGEPFDQPVTVGVINMMKLHHLVEDKVHARSIGPYSLITQQPLGGKAQFGGQRFGEMEVWALEAYGAAHILQEMLTIKSDDVVGRAKAYEAIIKGEEIEAPQVPASFNVLVKELQGLGFSVEAYDKDGKNIHFGKEEEEKRPPWFGLRLPK